MQKRVEFCIEIDRNTTTKYEYNKTSKKLEIDRIVPIPYPYDYGFFPDTLADDGDELDMLFISPHNNPLIRGEYLYVSYGYIVGGLCMEDEKGMDEKLFVVSETEYESFQQMTPEDREIIYDKIAHFFINYKKAEPNRWSKVHYFMDEWSAVQLYNKCCNSVNKNITQ